MVYSCLLGKLLHAPPLCDPFQPSLPLVESHQSLNWCKVSDVQTVQLAHYRPDGLIVSDDNLVDHVYEGMARAGVRIPRDVEVVAHCNFPVAAPSAQDAARLGYDVRAFLEQAVACLSRQRDGKRVKRVTRMPALFEWEMVRGGGVACEEHSAVSSRR